MTKIFTIFFVAFVLIFAMAQTSHAKWPIYNKPDFRGRVIDAETKKPLEGVVVVVSYHKYVFFPAFGSGKDKVTEAREMLTDKNGEFYFPDYIIITPFSLEDFARFTFYKRGYMYSYGPKEIRNRALIEKYFSTDVIGKIAEIRDGEFDHWTGALGIVELRRPKTDDDRKWAATPSLIGVQAREYYYLKDELPLLFKEIYGND